MLLNIFILILLYDNNYIIYDDLIVKIKLSNKATKGNNLNLKTLKMIPSIKKQINSLIGSIRGIMNAFVFVTFSFLLFAIIGL